MKTDEDRYIESRLTVFDRICQWFFIVPATTVFVLVINGMLGEPIQRSILLWVFVVGFFVSLILRIGIFRWRVSRLSDEYYLKQKP